MDSYLNLVSNTLEKGNIVQTRTGINAISIFGKKIEHDMSSGKFPLLTTKFVSLRLIASELEFFIKGITDKRWLQSRNNHIWDDWANPDILNTKYSYQSKDLEETLNKCYKEFLLDRNIIETNRLKDLFEQLNPYFTLESNTWKLSSKINGNNLPSVINTVKKITQYIERDLGPIYGFQWRHFGAEYSTYDATYYNKGYDQFQFILETLKKDPTSRRMILSAWNPSVKKQMALEPCHYTIQMNSTGKKIDLLWSQRSVDLMLGLPFNIGSYALLLKLMALETNLEARKLVGMLGNVHIYKNHIAGAQEQVKRTPKSLPELKIPNFTSIYDWQGDQVILENYDHYPSIKFPIAV